jgi:predicted outer membrane repeat protein
MRQVRLLSVVLAVVYAGFGLPAAGDIIYVSTCGDDTWSGAEQDCVGPDGPKATIQAAIDAAEPNGVVIVTPGVYRGTGNRDIVFGGGKTVRSIDPDDAAVVASTIIDCEKKGRGFYHSVWNLSGLTITNGIADSGGGIDVGAVNGATISKMRIVGNTATRFGGGIYCRGGLGSTNLLLENCVIAGNSAEDHGGGISTSYFNLTVNNCTVVNNNSNV